jgi:Mn2+/Fe2+ NRAMP family transporter
VVLWSVISAAFIGPGTVTTALSAGSLFGLELLWAVVFATAACVVLQEVAARIIIVAGGDMGRAIDQHFGARGAAIKVMVAVPVLLGCAAYEAGNILGAVSGAGLLMAISPAWTTAGVALAAAIILWQGGSQQVSWVMTTLVAIMGIAFLYLALQSDFSAGQIAGAAVVPTWPAHSSWVVLALVGTTIVPYNIFIGAAVSRGQTLALMRVGLGISVSLGGLITACILLAGASLGTFTSFTELAAHFEESIGPAGVWMLGLGLFAAGFSSAITSPYAASLMARAVFHWKNAWHVRPLWLAVLLTGFAFGISGVKPIPIILAVQALNGLVLPLLAYCLLVMVNNKAMVPRPHAPGVLYNGVLLLVFAVVLVMGLTNVDKGISGLFSLSGNHSVTVMAVSLLTVMLVGLSIFRHGSK